MDQHIDAGAGGEIGAMPGGAPGSTSATSGIKDLLSRRDFVSINHLFIVCLFGQRNSRRLGQSRLSYKEPVMSNEQALPLFGV